MNTEALADYLDAHSRQIGMEVSARMKEQRPDLFRRYRRRLTNTDKTPEEWCAEDTAHHLRALAAAVAINDPSDFERYRSWLVDLLRARNIPEEDVSLNFEVLAALLEDRLGDQGTSAVAMLRQAHPS